MNRTNRHPTIVALLILALLLPAVAQAIDFDRIVVFGTSLSDPGNAFALTGQAMSAPYSELSNPADLFVPSMPYQAGGHHFSNGATWIEQFAFRAGRGDTARPAFTASGSQATNYSVGGARARRVPGNVNLSDQVATFLADFNYDAPSGALYVIDMGANDVRDALFNPTEIGPIFTAALGSISEQILNLYVAGARKFLILNVANLGKIPSMLILDSLHPGTAQAAEGVTFFFNTYLEEIVTSAKALPGVTIAQLDVFSKVSAVTANPAAFGLANVTAPCVMPEVAPYRCQQPDDYLFWDGIHPTKAGHAILAQEVSNVLAQ